MGGTRPEQYTKEAGEPGAQINKGRQDEHLRDEDKAKVAESRVEAQESLIPKRGTNPALAELQAARERAAQGDREAGSADDDGRTG